VFSTDVELTKVTDMKTFLFTWYISVVAAILCLLPGFVAVKKMKSVREEIQSVIRSWDDLALVKAAINLNMLMGVVFIAEVALCVCLLGYFRISDSVSLRAAAAHAMTFSSVLLISARYFRKAENDFRRIRVESNDPQIASRLERWLKQWKEPRLRLPD
jgi:hypothetical protein